MSKQVALEEIFTLMEREIHLMRLISANRQAQQQALYINHQRYVVASRKEEERLRATLTRVENERLEQLSRSSRHGQSWQLQLGAEERARFEALSHQIAQWQQKLALNLQEIKRRSNFKTQLD